MTSWPADGEYCATLVNKKPNANSDEAFVEATGLPYPFSRAFVRIDRKSAGKPQSVYYKLRPFSGSAHKEPRGCFLIGEQASSDQMKQIQALCETDPSPGGLDLGQLIVLRLPDIGPLLDKPGPQIRRYMESFEQELRD